jgi:hypothetical protein
LKRFSVGFDALRCSSLFLDQFSAPAYFTPDACPFLSSMLPQVMPAPLQNPSLSRAKYPSPLYFDNPLGHSVSAPLPPQNSASPNKVDKDQPSPTSPGGNNHHYEDGGSSHDSGSSSSVPQAQELFARDNGSSYSTSSDVHTAVDPLKNDHTAQQQRRLPSLNGRTLPGVVTSREGEITNGYVSKSSSLTEVHSTSSFPHPLSAPHSQEHFSNTHQYIILTATSVMGPINILPALINIHPLYWTSAACQNPPYSEALDLHMPVHTLTRTLNPPQVAINRCNLPSTLRRSLLDLHIPPSIE